MARGPIGFALKAAKTHFNVEACRKVGESLLQRRKTFGHLRAESAGDGLKFFEIGAMLTNGFSDHARETLQALIFRNEFEFRFHDRSRFILDFGTTFFCAQHALSMHYSPRTVNHHA